MVAINLLHPSLLSHLPCTSTSTGAKPPPLLTSFGKFPHFGNFKLKQRSHVCCSTANKPSTSSPEISSNAKIRSEVLTPFRTVRMFFYLAFIASGGLGALISLTQLIPSLTNPSKSQLTPTILQSLFIDLCAVLLFGFLYTRENRAKNLQLARLSREESLSKLKLRISESKVISVNELRGLARLVIVAGSKEFISESFERSKEFTDGLVERGVLVVPFCTDGGLVEFKFEGEGENGGDEKRRRLWQLTPVIASSWAEWIDEQKKLANVAPDSPVYLSLRMDGRVRGSGVGYPPWNAFVAQLPPIKGIWTGLLDGMDGRV